MADAYVYTGEEGKDELRIVESLVNDTDMTADQAAQQIVDLTLATKTYSRQLGDHCSFTAGSLVSAARRTAPSEQSKLIAFLHDLRAKTVMDSSTGAILEYDGESIWKDLPTFGYTFADELHSIPSPNATPERIQQWQNFIAFIAQLDASTREPNLDFTHTWALMYISCAFDGLAPRHDHQLAVRFACIWYIYDAEKLWSKVPETKNFTLTNWQRWKRELEEEEAECTDEGMKKVVGKALAEIRRVELT